MIRVVKCDTCKGGGSLDFVEEMWFDGSWRRQRAPGLPHEMVDAWIAVDGANAPVRWTEGECHGCAGAGEYEVETTPCLIF